MIVGLSDNYHGLASEPASDGDLSFFSAHPGLAGFPCYVNAAEKARWERFGKTVSDICLLARAAGDAPRFVAEPARKRTRRRR